MIMTYGKAYDIAKALNDNVRGFFTGKEIAENAYDILIEYENSIKIGEPTETMFLLCEEICTDMDKADYPFPTREDLDLETMALILEDFWIELN